jgi:hypothetical protein
LVNTGTLLTVNDNKTLWGAGAVVPVPVIVTVTVPNVADPDAVNVNVDDPPAVTVEMGDAVTPVGNPLADNTTDCANPDVTADDTITPAEAQRGTDTDPAPPPPRNRSLPPSTTTTPCASRRLRCP